ncbi:lytic transglycosylase domain-containing protein [Paraburkholderia aspalathi]|uniref:lytic transglycosylase domain-containing protein n=1 Tax=Paraburkholderia aspalathi TaxID=1324617 RepID=UPI001FD612AC
MNLLRAMGRVESNYRPYVTNPKTGAIGEMQIMPFHLNWLKKYGIYERDLYDECTNINVAAFLLSDFIRMYGNTWRAVGAYGAGIAKDKEQARIGYAQQVQQAYERITYHVTTNPAPARESRTVSPVEPARPTMVVQQ